MINQEAQILSFHSGDFKIFSLGRFQNFKKKSERGKFIPNFPLKHVITSISYVTPSLKKTVFQKLQINYVIMFYFTKN